MQSSYFSFPSDAESHYYDIIERTSMFRNQPPHEYAGYGGPWVENHFIETFLEKPFLYFNGFIPLFIQWVDLMLNNKLPYVAEILRQILRPNVLYIAVSQSDTGLSYITERHPNILVISSGGYGHIPIPLIKDELPIVGVPEKFKFDISFCGNTKQWGREKILNDIEAEAKRLSISSYIVRWSKTWYTELQETKFTLAPRGYGRRYFVFSVCSLFSSPTLSRKYLHSPNICVLWGFSSFRFSEVIQTGRLPVYIYDDYEWLPYVSTPADISEYSFSLKSDSNVTKFLHVIMNVSSRDYLRRIDKVRELRKLFTYKGVMEQIALFLQDPLGPTGGYLRCTRLPDTEKGWRSRDGRTRRLLTAYETPP